MGPGTTPDDFETKLVREIYSMPPGRPGYTTIKTIEENLRSRAGQLGGTRKEVPMRLERLEAMGLFKRESRPRGNGHVEVGELVMDHPLMPSLTEGVSRTEARPQRLPRQPRSTAPRQVAPEAESAAGGEAEVEATAGAEAEAATEPAPRVWALPAPESMGQDSAVPMTEPEPEAQPEPEPEAQPEPKPERAPAPSAAEPETEAAPFRWVTSVGTPEVTATGANSAKAEAKAERAAPKPRKRAPRKTTTPRTSPRSKKAVPADDTEPDSPPGTESTNDLTTPV